MLNFMDEAAVKEFLTDVLIENRQIVKEASADRNRADLWFKYYQEQQRRADAAEEKIISLQNTIDLLKDSLHERNVEEGCEHESL